MFRREMGSKRGSLPPKEGDLTCMDSASLKHSAKLQTLQVFKSTKNIVQLV